MAGYGEDVYITLLMSDSYLPGAAVLAHSLRDARTSKKLAVLVTLDNLSTDTITALKDLYDYIIPVDRIRTPNLKNLYLMDRADLAYAFTKIALWRQTQFRKIVYIDADVVALRAPDELFDIDASFAAAPDVGWPDCFNTGVMVIKPDMGEYWALKTLASAGDSFDGADQGLLNQYYEHKDWHRLSFTYNCTPNAQYQWEPAYRYFKRDIAMVHFIGKDKPWTKGRQSGGNGGSGVYNELLGRWWAVYDKHLKSRGPSQQSYQLHQQHQQHHPSQPSDSSHYSQHSQTSQESHSSLIVQQHVVGESTNTDYGYSSISHLTSQPQSGEPEAPPQTETPFSEAGEVVDNIETGHTQPVPTVEQRRFSAPQMEWDATRSAPPPESKPEAEHFPTQQYTFSDDKELFHAPQSYPEPPKDMWYEVPEEKPAPKYEPPKPIFPWEQDSNRPKPTRVFVEDLPPPPQPGPESISEEGSSTSQADSSSSPSITSPRYEDPWQAFTQSKNAWDAVPGIDSYVRAVKHAHERRGKPHPGPLPSGLEGVLSPSSIPGTKASNRQLRRESLILTDFPSADERPSLPVTPAPIRRPTFWGDDRDEAGELPGAEGVPDQIDWNPEQQLEQLRRSSLVEIEHLRSGPALALRKHESVPTTREMVKTAAKLPSPPISSPEERRGVEAEKIERSDERVLSPMPAFPPRKENFEPAGIEEDASPTATRKQDDGEVSPTQTHHPTVNELDPTAAIVEEAELTGIRTKGKWKEMLGGFEGTEPLDKSSVLAAAGVVAMDMGVGAVERAGKEKGGGTQGELNDVGESEVAAKTKDIALEQKVLEDIGGDGFDENGLFKARGGNSAIVSPTDR